jgi:integrase
VIRVERSWDDKEGFVEPKSRVGRRTVPIPSVLRSYLAEHRLRSHDLSGLAFGAGGRPIGATGVRKRSAEAWKAAELEPITLHEARHTFASLMIAAGVNAKALSTYMGHANIAITLDRYGHLMPGNEAEAAGLLDTYLATRLGAGPR